MGDIHNVLCSYSRFLFTCQNNNTNLSVMNAGQLTRCKRYLEKVKFKDEVLRKRFYCFDTSFYRNLHFGGYQSVRNLTDGVDIFAYDLLFIPVERQGWNLAIICNPGHTEDQYPVPHIWLLELGFLRIPPSRAIFTVLRDYLEHEWADKKKDQPIRKFEPRKILANGIQVFPCVPPSEALLLCVETFCKWPVNVTKKRVEDIIRNAWLRGELKKIKKSIKKMLEPSKNIPTAVVTATTNIQSVAAILKVWHPSSRLSLKPIEDLFNDQIKYQCKSFDELIELNRKLPTVAKKFRVFECTASSIIYLQTFLANMELLKTFLGEVEELVQDAPTKLEQVNGSVKLLNEQLRIVEKKLADVNQDGKIETKLQGWLAENQGKVNAEEAAIKVAAKKKRKIDQLTKEVNKPMKRIRSFLQQQI